MLTKKSIGIALVCALALGASGAALATTITLDGVTWDTSSPADLNIQSLNLRETEIAGVGDVLNGYGQIGSINGINSFCSSCDLTFTFTYTVSSLGTSGSGNPQAVFDNGSIQLYVSPNNPDGSGTYSEFDPTTASLGTKWLTLTGHTGELSGFVDADGNPIQGQLFSNITGTVSNPLEGSGGHGFLDATGGPAAQYMDSNTIADGLGGFADFSINSSFLVQPLKGCGSTPTTDLDISCSYPISGTALQIGASKTVSVPEPGELGLLGLGLGFLGLLVWRRRKEDDKRA